MNTLPPISTRLVESLDPAQRALFFEYERLQDEGRELWQVTFEREIARHLTQP